MVLIVLPAEIEYTQKLTGAVASVLAQHYIAKH
jgi:hypothetical protein